MDDSIKDAFFRVKSDIISLKEEINQLREDISTNREQMQEICEILKQLNEKTENLTEEYENYRTKAQFQTDFYKFNTPTQGQEISANPTHNPAIQHILEPLKSQNLGISTGNEGVPTDKQTNQQTDKQQVKSSHNLIKEGDKDSIGKASELLDSLDNIKKELRLKFKRLTDQEILVFSVVYQLDEEKGFSDYKTISKRLNLTESSIRDYIGRLIKKGIPVEKKRLNNKNIQLTVSPNLKKIASLSTILKLRDL